MYIVLASVTDITSPVERGMAALCFSLYQRFSNMDVSCFHEVFLKTFSCLKMKLLSVFHEFIDYLYMSVVGLWYTALAPLPLDVELYHFR
jgi:hypothetical protein